MLYRSDAYSVEITARDIGLSVASDVLEEPLGIGGGSLTGEPFVLLAPRSVVEDATKLLNGISLPKMKYEAEQKFQSKY